ncbi:hypothetical protein FB45DRAFT_261508 [Roridomyces roridus]|uniref:Uncharacterized protein n=1 Tax=Roridomyces roridus TaxID=1738132 RepID=A0AAD7B9C6_9AGAR|nr:hypothetical protein FB45DRAFT_261508 [Roridomyces roridus]
MASSIPMALVAAPYLRDAVPWRETTLDASQCGSAISAFRCCCSYCDTESPRPLRIRFPRLRLRALRRRLPPQHLPASAPINIVPNPPRTSTASGAAAASASAITSASPPTTNTGSNLCENCQIRPKYSNGGKVHPYCSKSCASQAKLPLHPPNSTSTIPKSAHCESCGLRPKFFDGKRTHPVLQQGVFQERGRAKQRVV